MDKRSEQETKRFAGTKTDRIQSIVDDCLRRWSAGETINEGDLLAAHQELMPELGHQLQRARSIMHAAHDTTNKSAADMDTPSTDPQTADVNSARPLSIRCPHCHCQIEMLADSPFTDITCHGCGGTFSIVARDDDSSTKPPLKSVEHFELFERLGMGAFATVWKAHDIELDREVAIKIPRRGALDPLKEEHFLREARVAAQLRHPNIVSVHEVGRDDDTLYIVSDLVRGVNLFHWLEENTPTFTQTAQLCLTIAEALHHAHEAGVVHRDLKPSNIMIDEQGAPHLTDFGLARRDAGDVTMTTDGNVLGTPTHMSPEQARGEGHAADRRTDIYSLGVILFQLLTGELPFRGNVKMLLYQVLHDDPPRARRLNNRVPRDLETICLKCLEKEPERRYATASAVADDIQRYLSSQPIAARPPSTFYRVRKFTARHRLPVALVSILFVAISATAIVATVMSVRFVRQRDRAITARRHESDARQSADEVIDFLVTMFETGDPFAAGETEPRVRQIVDAGVERLQDLGDQPLVQARLQTALGKVYTQLSEFERAEELLRTGLATRERELGEDNRDVAESLIALHELCISTRRYDEGYELLPRALEIRRRQFGDASPLVTEVIDTQATNRFYANDLEPAVEFFREVVSRKTQALGSGNAEVLQAQANLGAALRGLGKLEDAESLLRDVLADQQQLLGDHIETAHTIDKLTHVMWQKGDAAAAEGFAKQRVDVMRRAVHDSHPELLHALHNYAFLLQANQGPQAAVPIHREVLAKRRALLGNDHKTVAETLNDLGFALKEADELEEAEVHLTEALRIRRKLFDGSSEIIAWSAYNLASLYHKTDRWERAETLFLESYQIQEANYPGQQNDVAMKAVNSLVRLYEQSDRIEEAQQWQEKLVAP